MSTIIGFSSGTHDANISLIQNGVIKAVYVEERFSIYKQQGGTIKKSLDALLNDYNISLDDVDHFVTSTPIILDSTNDIVEKFKNKIQYYPHHLCHQIGSLIFGNYHDKDNVMLLSLDGGDFNVHNLKHGDYISTNIFDWLNETKNIHWFDKYKHHINCISGELSVYTNGEIKSIKQFNANFGRLYFLGVCMLIYYYNVKSINMEEKLMSMSSSGKYNDHIYRTFRNLCVFDKTTESFINHIPDENKTGNWDDGRLHDTILGCLKEYNVEDICFNLQKCVEDGCLELIQYYQSKFNCKYLCLSGGFFANLKVNQRINETLDFEEIFVMPSMGDDGISIGASLLKSIELNEYKFLPTNVYLGKNYTDQEITKFVRLRCLHYYPYEHNIIANELKNGKIVGIFRGPTEIGQRCLGNRSILADASNKNKFERLIKRLHRHQTLSCGTCCVLEDDFENLVHCLKSKKASEYLTLCHSVKDGWYEKIPSVIDNNDQTIYPQLVNKENKWLYELMNIYKYKTNIPVLLNVSFSKECFPVINSPMQAWDALRERLIDVLVLGDYIVYHDKNHTIDNSL